MVWVSGVARIGHPVTVRCPVRVDGVGAGGISRRSFLSALSGAGGGCAGEALVLPAPGVVNDVSGEGVVGSLDDGAGGAGDAVLGWCGLVQDTVAIRTIRVTRSAGPRTSTVAPLIRSPRDCPYSTSTFGARRTVPVRSAVVTRYGS